jgi:hypothetical protein
MDPADAAITKMIAGAILPGDENHSIYSRGERDANVRVIAHYNMARAAVLGLLHLAVDTSGKPANNVIGGCCVDLQIVAKIETGFGVGKFSRTSNNDEDEELSKATMLMTMDTHSSSRRISLPPHSLSSRISGHGTMCE